MFIVSGTNAVKLLVMRSRRLCDFFFHSFVLKECMCADFCHRHEYPSMFEMVIPSFLGARSASVKWFVTPCAPAWSSLFEPCFQKQRTSVSEVECCCQLGPFFFNVTLGSGLGVSSNLLFLLRSRAQDRLGKHVNLRSQDRTQRCFKQPTGNPIILAATGKSQLTTIAIFSLHCNFNSLASSFRLFPENCWMNNSFKFFLQTSTWNKMQRCSFPLRVHHMMLSCCEADVFDFVGNNQMN